MDAQGNAVEDEDFLDEFYCKHGTFVGSPLGGDYMCGWCELGTTDEEFETYIQLQRNRLGRKNAVRLWLDLVFEDWPPALENDKLPSWIANIVIGMVLAMNQHNG